MEKEKNLKKAFPQLHVVSAFFAPLRLKKALGAGTTSI
jgi:hypothetical protein